MTLLTKATTLKPDLPMFALNFQARAGPTANAAPTVIPALPAANGHAHPPASSQPSTIAPTETTLPTAPPPAIHTTTGLANATTDFVDNADEGYGPEEHPAHYPRPGQGLMRTLPPEQEDLQWLVDDDDRFGVFSHMYQVDPHAASSGMNGGIGQRQ